MNHSLLAKGMTIAFRGMGIIIYDWKSENNQELIFISVPKETTDTSFPLAGKALANRFLTKLHKLGATNVKVKFTIRNEVWTVEKRLAAEHSAKTSI